MKNTQAPSIIRADHVHLDPSAARIGVQREGKSRTEPRIELIYDGDVVRALEVICSCGERIRIRCDYE